MHLTQYFGSNIIEIKNLNLNEGSVPELWPNLIINYQVVTEEGFFFIWQLLVKYFYLIHDKLLEILTIEQDP